MDDDLERFFAALAVRAGTPAIGSEEAGAVLDLTRIVAHGSERRYAPVAAYAAGLAMAEGAAPDERTARVRAVVAAVQELLSARAEGERRSGPVA